MDELKKMVTRLLFLTAELHEHIALLNGEIDSSDYYSEEEQENEALMAEAYEEDRLRAMMREIFDELYWEYENRYRR